MNMILCGASRLRVALFCLPPYKPFATVRKPALTRSFARLWTDNYPPHSVEDVAGKRAAMVAKLGLIFPGVVEGEDSHPAEPNARMEDGKGSAERVVPPVSLARAALEESGWDWTVAMRMMTARAQAVKAAKREARGEPGSEQIE